MKQNNTIHTRPYHTIPDYHYTTLHYTPLYYTIPYILYYTIPYGTILFHTIAYYTILYHTRPYYTILNHTFFYTKKQALLLLGCGVLLLGRCRGFRVPSVVSFLVQTSLCEPPPNPKP